MRFQLLLAIAACCALASAAATPDPARGRDPDIGAKELPERDLAKHSPREPHFPKPVYFKGTNERILYDDRFADYPVDESEQHDAFRVLIQTYLATLRDLGVQTWLMHGSLLGWWWGKKVLPWDLDADVQVSEADMYYLAAYHNMTVHYYKYGDMKRGRFFLLEINPHFKYRGQDDTKNVIDARWIDMNTGLFIDITAARYDPDHPKGDGILYDKNGHEYRDTYLYPLLETTFEGVPALIPFKYREMLASEYNESALKNRRFNSHVFDEELEQWVPAEEL